MKALDLVAQGFKAGAVCVHGVGRTGASHPEVRIGRSEGRIWAEAECPVSGA